MNCIQQLLTREFFREIASFISGLSSLNEFFSIMMNLFATDVEKNSLSDESPEMNAAISRKKT